jgi:hypothetical protein
MITNIYELKDHLLEMQNKLTGYVNYSYYNDIEQLLNKVNVEIELDNANNNSNTIIDMNTYITKLIMLLSQFQKKDMYGQYIDDPTWLYCDSTKDCRFKLRESDKILYNSSMSGHEIMAGIANFLNTLVSLMNIYSMNIKTELKFVEDDSNDITWILLIIN